MLIRVSVLLSCCLLALPGPRARADELRVSPGPSAITQPLTKAKDGDVLKVAAGQYTESIELSVSVTLEGAGADSTTLMAVKYAAINCAATQVRIVGLTIKPAEQTVRGVNSSLPVRIERCRFVG